MIFSVIPQPHVSKAAKLFSLPARVCSCKYISACVSVVMTEMVKRTMTIEAAAVEAIITDAVKRSNSVDARRKLTTSAIVSQTLVYIWWTHNFNNNNNNNNNNNRPNYYLLLLDPQY